MSYGWHDLIGNIGVVLVLATYLFVQMGRMDIRSPGYSGANAAGAVLIIVSLAYDFNLSSFLIEIVWLLISLIGLYRWQRQRAQAKSQLMDPVKR